MTYVTQVDAVSAVSNYVSDNIDSIYNLRKNERELLVRVVPFFNHLPKNFVLRYLLKLSLYKSPIGM